MPASFFTKAALSLALAGAAVVPMSGTSFAGTAGSNTGTITQYYLDNTVLGRGACIEMSPALATGYACTWVSPLFKEQNELLLDAYLNKKACSIAWETQLDVYDQITIVQCH
jgi:hypothetical protein